MLRAWPFMTGHLRTRNTRARASAATHADVTLAGNFSAIVTRFPPLLAAIDKDVTGVT